MRLTDLPSPLPPHLAERVHPVGTGTADPGTGPVVYWMRTAVRGHDNPALDVALRVGRLLDRPVLVYHALSERYPYASDRHHRFILEGARDVQAELAQRGIAYAFHLERPGHRGPHLKTLGATAALVVTEDVPVSPLREWTAALASALDRPVWTVDAACTHPMRLTPRSAVDRAFRFRSATAEGRRSRLEAGWDDEPPHRRPRLPPLPFEPLELATADLDGLVARCAIDHGVAPVSHTPGGTRAGYARWRSFVEGGLAHYHRTRNDPMRDGVSRMSPYLHYGQVSPFRLAREALAEGGEGAEKFLDELLVWRELAWAFCAWHPDHDTVAVLPDWARRTLADHAADPRPALPSWETLARGRTGDALWDAAQRSLLIHGELHNNVRMTWGKALPSWTPDAARALALLEDLNHRYALDGRDPASYGGILWCLGMFDRPFSPERSILGTVRSRSTRSHARRLDPAAWGARTTRPALERPPRVAVIGAGLAGLACARTLVDHGLRPVVFDKGRRPGGRCATRESRTSPRDTFDHGAQYFTARDPRFRRWVEAWRHDGRVAVWDGASAEAPPSSEGPSESRWVGVPSMAALPEGLAADLDVRRSTRVVSVLPHRGAARVETESGEAADFDVVVVTTPPAQAIPLLRASPALEAVARRARMDPCWAVMLSFDRPLPTGADTLRPGGRMLAWCARDGAKPGRPGGERWVLHATAEWSVRRLDARPEEVADLLADAFLDALDLPEDERPKPLRAVAHLWRFARVAEGAGTPTEAAADPAVGLVIAGDWVAGEARLEAAWLSGVAAAARVLAMGRDGPVVAGGPPSRPLPPTSEQADLFG